MRLGKLVKLANRSLACRAQNGASNLPPLGVERYYSLVCDYPAWVGFKDSDTPLYRQNIYQLLVELEKVANEKFATAKIDEHWGGVSRDEGATCDVCSSRTVKVLTPWEIKQCMRDPDLLYWIASKCRCTANDRFFR